MKFRPLVCAVLCCIALAPAGSSAGPIRDWVNSKRPGILIPLPNQYAPFPACPQAAPACPCPCNPGVGIPATPFNPPTCPGGVCPLPRPVAPKTFSILPVGAPVVSATPKG